MGDRVSISFKNGDEESVALFHHWGGTEFPEVAKEYAEELKQEMAEARIKEPRISDPLTRLEPQVVMVDFIRYLAQQIPHDVLEDYSHRGRSTTSIYLGKDQNDGDNSDNGHHIINLSA